MSGILWIALQGMAYERVHIDMPVETGFYWFANEGISAFKDGELQCRVHGWHISWS